MQTMRDHILKRIARFGQGKAFSAKDFLDIASRTTIDVALAELAMDGRSPHIIHWQKSSFLSILDARLQADLLNLRLRTSRIFFRSKGRLLGMQTL
jgi:hypothetical protein